MIPDAKGLYSGAAHTQRYVPYDTLVHVPQGEAMQLQQTESTRERLAALEHARWSRWMEYMFSLGTFHADGTWTMPAEKVARWQRQMTTDYRDLSEPEKDSDRAEGDRTLQVLGLEPPTDG